MIYDLRSADSYVHLTNYSVQKYNKEFSKFEEGNEVSFSDFQVTYIFSVVLLNNFNISQ